MALYGPAIKKLVPHGSEDPRIIPRVVILHIAVSEASTLYHYFNGPSGGIESHFYVRRSGVTEQYRDTNTQADANEGANGFAISIETQGMGHGEWGPEQMAAIKRLILWLASAHRNIPLVVVRDAYGSGVGFHVMFPGIWDSRGATCPGPDRQKQFWDEIAPWLGSGGGTQDVPFVPPTVPDDEEYYNPPVDRSVESIQTIVGVAADGFYGDNTKTAVARYQKGLGVKADGYWGQDTEQAYKDKKGSARDRFYRPPVKRSVKAIQRIVDVPADGLYGPSTRKAVRRYQKKIGESPTDGWWGKGTEASHRKYVRSVAKSKDIAVDGVMGPATVSLMQEWLGVTIDGIFGNRTEKALQTELGVAADGIFGTRSTKALQKRVGVTADGIWGGNTTAALQRYLNKVT